MTSLKTSKNLLDFFHTTSRKNEGATQKVESATPSIVSKKRRKKFEDDDDDDFVPNAKKKRATLKRTKSKSFKNSTPVNSRNKNAERNNEVLIESTKINTDSESKSDSIAHLNYIKEKENLPDESNSLKIFDKSGSSSISVNQSKNVDKISSKPKCSPANNAFALLMTSSFRKAKNSLSVNDELNKTNNEISSFPDVNI